MSWQRWGCGSAMPWSHLGGRSNRGENMSAPPQNMVCGVTQVHAQLRHCKGQALHQHMPNEAASAAGDAGCRRWLACRATGWMTPGQQLAMSEEQRKRRLADSSRSWTSQYSQLHAMAQNIVHLIYGMRHEVLAELLTTDAALHRYGSACNSGIAKSSVFVTIGRQQPALYVDFILCITACMLAHRSSQNASLSCPVYDAHALIDNLLRPAVKQTPCAHESYAGTRSAK